MQRELLDAYADHLPLTLEVEQIGSDWLRGQRELELLTSTRDEQTARPSCWPTRWMNWTNSTCAG